MEMAKKRGLRPRSATTRWAMFRARPMIGRRPPTGSFEARLTNPLTWVVTRSMNSTSFRAIEAARDEEPSYAGAIMVDVELECGAEGVGIAVALGRIRDAIAIRVLVKKIGDAVTVGVVDAFGCIVDSVAVGIGVEKVRHAVVV